jgi:L-amino acid N-acyltransferase YncA
MRIRPAVLTDAPAVSALYAAHVLTGTASFEIAPPDSVEMERRIKAVLDRGHPWSVAEAEDSRLLGYAYASLFHPRAAYAHTFENSDYLASDAQGQRLGTALMRENSRSAKRRTRARSLP